VEKAALAASEYSLAIYRQDRDKNKGVAWRRPKLTQQIMFIVLNMMPDQKRAVFLSKCFRSMMLSLTTNVRPNVIKLRLAHRESRVSILPCKIIQVRECFFKPMRRRAGRPSIQQEMRGSKGASEHDLPHRRFRKRSFRFCAQYH
jgi:hypothetical protein